VYVPEVYHALCTRRLLVTEWIDGVKLSDLEGPEVQELTALGQECFLVQLLQVGSPTRRAPHIVALLCRGPRQGAWVFSSLLLCVSREGVQAGKSQASAAHLSSAHP
jgi:hypothetical protein